MILFRKQQDEASKHSTQRKPSTKAFDKTQERIELERGKGAGLSKLSDEEIAMQDLDNRQEIDFRKWCGFIDYRKNEAILQTDGQQTKFIFWGGSNDWTSMMRWLHASSEGWVSKMSMLCTPELDNRIANSNHFIRKLKGGVFSQSV